MKLEYIKKFYESSNLSNDSRLNLGAYFDFELDDYNQTHLSYPILIGLKVTNRCNMNCIYCFNEGAISKDLSIEKFNIIANKFKKNKPYMMYITGGEPFLNKDIMNIIKKIKEYNIRLHIHTNGLLLNKEKICELKKLLDKEDKLQISLDCHNEETHKSITGNNKFNQILKAIKDLKENGIKIKVNTVVSNKNIDILREIYALVNNLRVDELSLSTFMDMGNNKDVYLPDTSILIEKFNDVCEFMYKDKNNYTEITQSPIAVSWGNSSLFDIVKRHKLNCPAGRTEFEIDTNGDVYPCPFLYSEDFKMGNIINDSLEDVWKSSKANILRSNVWSNNKLCLSCESSNLCRGGCIASAYINNTNYDVRCDKHYNREVELCK